MAMIAGLSLSSPTVFFKTSASPAQPIKLHPLFIQGSRPGMMTGSGRMAIVRPVRAAPERISEKVEESIKNAKETCADDPVSGECVAAWDEVEELSAAASHARDRKKETDPLEDYCKDNPETKECKTFDD
ncbi:calvin cycle protein CP12-2, chloroplastic-like [Lotus japonicus]|uniref:calvin cycle protein CP12-2, chloroplastic-like n=1 Tax=Lotus japonicus TaxID=34305 RepID=UPI0025884910|nr:calvin cycle protein CP12-2, chloroplastic-like [Lotus japonicus]